MATRAMIWQEIIRIRTLSPEQFPDSRALRKELRAAAQPGDQLLAAIVLRNASVGTDFAILLIWAGDAPSEKGSNSFLQASADLKDLGQISHSVWTVVP